MAWELFLGSGEERMDCIGMVTMIMKCGYFQGMAEVFSLNLYIC